MSPSGGQQKCNICLAQTCALEMHKSAQKCAKVRICPPASSWVAKCIFFAEKRILTHHSESAPLSVQMRTCVLSPVAASPVLFLDICTRRRALPSSMLSHGYADHSISRCHVATALDNVGIRGMGVCHFGSPRGQVLLNLFRQP